MLSKFNFYGPEISNTGPSPAATATATGGATQMDSTMQNPTLTFVGIVLLLVVIRVLYEVAD